MSATKVATTRTNGAAGPTKSLEHRRSTLGARSFGGGTVEQGKRLQRKFASRSTLQLLSQRVCGPTANRHSDPQVQEAEQMPTPDRLAVSGLSWEFSRIPLFPPDQASRPQTRSPSPTLPLSGVPQPTLAIEDFDDRLEHDPDRVAGQAMGRTPAPELSVSAAPSQLSRKCAACEEEAAQTLQTKPAGSTEVAERTAPSMVHEVLREHGQPLDRAVQAALEPIFRHDFSAVRVHSDSKAAESAKGVGALAYTVGSDIVFRSGQYSPETKAGRRLLTHELTHVVQQRHTPPKATLLQSKLPIGDPADRFERQAEAAADRLANLDEGFAQASNPALQRQSDQTGDEADGTTTSQPESPSGSIDITEALFEEDTGNSGQLQTAPDPTPGPLLQRQADIPPPPPAYPSSSEWFFDFVGADVDFGSLFGMTCEDGRERGFYVMWNERTNKSFPGPIEIGDPVRGCKTAHIELGPVPPDRKPIYPVGFFHTHPLANPGCHKLGVGPSPKDLQTAKDNGLPGLVEDTITPTSTCRDAGYFFFGATRRS
jgi:Domain of unknown function (DUF4157)